MIGGESCCNSLFAVIVTQCKRTGLQCLSQWMKKVKPREKVDRKWTQQEEDLLKELVLTHGVTNFMFIGSHFEHRTPLQCSSRWLKSSAPYIRSGEWDINEVRNKLYILRIGKNEMLFFCSLPFVNLRISNVCCHTMPICPKQ